MCTSLARVGRWRVCVHFNGATVATWVTEVAGRGGVNLFVVLDGDANTQLWVATDDGLRCGKGKGRETVFWLGATTMGGWSVEEDKNGSRGDNAGANPRKGSYDRWSFHAIYNTVRMLTFVIPFAIINCTLIAQFDNYSIAYHREKQQWCTRTYSSLSGWSREVRPLNRLRICPIWRTQ